jgi:hypothetical protein
MSPEKEIANNLNSYPFGEKIAEEHLDFCIDNNLIIVTQVYNDRVQLKGVINKTYYSDEIILLGTKGDTIKIPISLLGYEELDYVSKDMSNTDSVSVPNTVKNAQNYIGFNQLKNKFYTDLPFESFFLIGDDKTKEQGIVINLNNLKKWD